MNGRASEPPSELEIHPAGRERWPDLERLFGPSGAYSGCWCMWWRLTSSAFARNGNAGNRAALETLVAGGEVPGLLAYRESTPVGWCSLGPRQAFGRLQRSPVLKPVDDEAVWSIVCFYIARDQRRRGVAGALVQAAIDYAARQGAQVIEAYPRDLGAGRTQDSAVFTGTVGLFERAGFVEVARRKPGRPIMRRRV